MLDTFRSVWPANFNALYDRRNEANIGELINIVLDHIEEANKAKLEGVFRNIDFNSEANLGQTKDRKERSSRDDLSRVEATLAEGTGGRGYRYEVCRD